MTIRSLTLTTAAIIGLAVAPAHARLVKLTVAGHITSGSDGGNDLDDVTNGPGGYVEHFAPGSVFGTIGDLTGNAIRFSFIYDTNDAAQPLGVGGVFDDQLGQWAYDATKAVTIGAVTHDFLPLQPVFTFIALTATLGVTDGTPDGLSGNFTGFTGWGDVYSNFYTSGLSFGATLPSSFFATDAVLPGNLPGPGFGLAGSGASGTGSFSFVRQTCFLTCSYKAAVGNFALTAITFGAVPEPASWALMIVGFGLVGARQRRRSGTTTVAA